MKVRGRDPSAATEAVLDRMAAVEAAVADLRDPAITFPLYAETKTGAFRYKLQNRILTAALLLTHLEDAARRLAKRLGVSPADVSQPKSVALQILRRLSNSWKHGLGGKQADGAVLNGILMVQRRESANAARPAPDATVHVVGMMVGDSQEGACPSSNVIDNAIKYWGALLAIWVPEAADWANRCVLKPKGPVIQLKSDGANAAPAGATVVMEVSPELSDKFSKDVKRRIAKS